MITKRTSSLSPRRLSLLPRLSALPPRFLLLILLAAAGLAAAVARGDETTRRVQEELRKRNLYYGDIDGQRTRATAGALRRYQERKGFAATGEPDEITLRSLSIEPPSFVAASREDESAPAENAADGSSGPWPTGTVLKSDRAPRPRAISGSEGDPERDLFSTAITNLSTRGGGGDPPAGAATTAPSIPPPPASGSVARPPEKSGSPPAVSSRPPVGKPLSLDEARQFIEDYLRAGETNQLDEELKFYADQVNYFNQGTVGRAYKRRAGER